MPGPKDLKERGARRCLGPFVVLALFAGVLAAAAVFAAARGAAPENRHRMRHPTRSLPSAQTQTAFEFGFGPEQLGRLVGDGAVEAIAPNGNRLFLTLDEQLQKEMFELLRRYDPDYGVLAAMEPSTGRVRALLGYRRGGESDPWLALKAIYPAASLIKVVTAAAALEKGNVTPDAEIAYRGGIYGITRRGLHAREGRGVPSMSLEEAIARSANSVFGKVAVDYVGSEGLREYLGKFGFEQLIPFALPVEPSRGEVPRDEFNLARTGAGFGEVYVSPLHVAMIMSAVGARGVMPVPYLVERVEDKDGAVLYEAAPAAWRRAVSVETAETLLSMMVKSVEIGTCRRAFGTPESTPLLRDMQVAGKTGSLSGWTPRRHFEWFAGVAPVSGPELAVAALVVNDGKWKIKGNYVGKEAFNSYFGYPSSDPPAYAKARSVRKARVHARSRGRAKARLAGRGKVLRKRESKPPAAGFSPSRGLTEKPPRTAAPG